MFKLFFNQESYQTPINAEQLQQILDSIITAHLAGHAFIHTSPYSWRNDKGSFRKCIGYTKLKGESGTLTWGINLGFIPVVKKKIEWFRTDKRFLMHLSDHPAEYKRSFIGKDITKGTGSHWGEKNAIRTISALWNRNENKYLNGLPRHLPLKG